MNESPPGRLHFPERCAISNSWETGDVGDEDAQFFKTLGIKNFLDKNVTLVEQMGFPSTPEILANASRLFSLVDRHA